LRLALDGKACKTMTHQLDDDNPDASLALSKRAARRIIQRAWVLAGRDRRVRQHLRSAGFSTLWILEDWNFTWTVNFDRGRLDFDRRPTKRPDLTFTWQSAAGFFAEIETGKRAAQGFAVEGDLALQRLCEPIYRSFSKTLQTLLGYPVDANGQLLV
jgi:hypothetical protein